MDTPTLIGDALAATGWSRAQLARESGIPQSVLSAYEHGRRDPTVTSLNRVLGAAGLQLATRPAHRPQLPRRVDPIVAERELRDVLSFVDALPFVPTRQPLSYPLFPRR